MKYRGILASVLMMAMLFSGCSADTAAAKRIAEKYHLTFIPLQEKFDEACKSAPADYWLRDGVHPTPMGHWLIKNEWMKAFAEL